MPEKIRKDENSESAGELLSLHGKTAVITGGRRGIGRATAVKLARAGAGIVVVAKNDTAGEVEMEVRKNGGAFFYCQADLCCREARNGLMAKIYQVTGSIDILVNNAGSLSREGIENCNWELWDSAVSSMLEAPYDLIQQVIPFMSPKGGCIVNLSSINAVPHWHCPYLTYGIVKSAVGKLTATAARELGGRGIRVNAVAPGLVYTDINRDQFAEHPEWFTATPLRRIATVDDIANGILYLCSPLGNFVNGHILVIDGGTTA